MKSASNKNPQEQAVVAKAFALATELQSKGKHPEAQRIYEELLAIAPDHAGAMNNFGLMLLDLNQPDKALSLLKKSALLQPKNAKAWNSLGSAQRKLGQFDQAIKSFDTALKIDPRYANAWFNRANSCWELERFAEAAANYRKAYDTDKNIPEIDRCLGAMALQAGDLDEAIVHYRRVLEKDPDNSEAAYHIIQSKKVTGTDDPDFQCLERLDMSAKQSMHTRDWLAYLNFALAKAYSDLGEDDKSFEKLDYANNLKRTSWNIPPEQFEDVYATLDVMSGLATKEKLDSCKDAAIDTDMPIFIVGIPRSGTMLTEQILASHPDVFGAGELKTFSQLVMRHLGQNPLPDLESAQYEAMLNRLDSKTLRRIGEEYLEKIREISGGKKHVTDKMPGNFFWLGLIKTVFPKAKIIHCRRDPIDTCFSIYQRLFFENIYWAYDQTEVGRYYKHYEKLMTHWARLFPDGMYNQKYEDMVSDQEGQTRKLLAHCGLNWDERCLKFYEQGRTVRTASMQQIRMPIYKSSVQAWKKHEKHLQPLIEALNTDADTHKKRAGERIAALPRTEKQSKPSLTAEEQKKEDLVRQVIAKTQELERLSKYEDAHNILQQLLDHAPQNAAVALNLGSISHKLGRLDDALRWLKRALELDSKNANIMLSIAATHLDLGQSEKALEYVQMALAAEPDNIRTYGQCGNLLCEIGRIDEGIGYYRRALEKDPTNTAILQDLSRLKKFTADDPDLAHMAAINRDALSDEQKIQLDFALGKAYGDTKNYDRSFANYLTANELVKKKLDYEWGSVPAYFDRIAEIFTPALAKKFEGQGYKTGKAIFVVGMPRSGTTLTEQILASHHAVTGGGEMPYFAQSVPFFENPELPDCFSKTASTLCAGLVENLSASMLGQIGRAYIEKITKINPDAQYITDKLPFNFLWVGLIRLALPDAKIVYVRRDPVDNCFSCFKTRFTHYIPWTHDLTEIAKVYKSHDRLMNHWKEIFGDAIYTVRYENLVADQEAESRRLLEYCGLEWDDACLSFHENERRVNTASVYQVRQPVYKDAVKRWEKYRTHLAPLIEELGDLANG